ncbi:MAG: hypothetical protein ACUVXA_12795 [Candidatus Jordarchaeum sp.]|uniref:hypothetical protein n=1 Tax=Candidatus Jordarchaeum sp. TaxID=2823881 RepID=UPI00404A9299
MTSPPSTRPVREGSNFPLTGLKKFLNSKRQSIRGTIIWAEPLQLRVNRKSSLEKSQNYRKEET